VQTYWATSINPGGGTWWLDPKSKDFGPNAKYFQRDIAEAKKLLAAAGYPNGFEATSSYIGGTQLGADFQTRVQVMESFSQDVGIRYKDNVVDYTVDYIPHLRDSNGGFDGVAFRAGGGSALEATVILSSRYHSRFGAQAFAGFDLNGKGDQSGDPAIDAMIGKARTEPDAQKRRALVHDIQRTLAKSVWDISFPGLADSYYLSWPVIGNFHYFQGDRREKPLNWWLDDSQPPVKKA
jgi:peptide/nickel transport system substrate-binding protein